MNDSPLALHDTIVQPEWIDYNGHMNEARYMEVFGETSTTFYNYIGIDEAYRQRTHCSVFAIEAHIYYLHESKLAEKLHVTTQLLNHDKGRIYLFHRMYQTESQQLAATFELMSVYVNLLERKIALFPFEIHEKLRQILALHSQLVQPKNGRIRF
jgi:acyl-CoA thioesterase FadM